MPALTTYSSVTLGVNTPVQLTLPTTPSGHYVLYLLNTVTGGKLYISDRNNPGANATSFMLPTGLYSPALPVSNPLWIASDTAGTVSAYCSPRLGA
jgi:hypothetical protein